MCFQKVVRLMEQLLVGQGPNALLELKKLLIKKDLAATSPGSLPHNIIVSLSMYK